ncbi:lipase family protein [Streptomyces sp. NPDC001709]
MAVPSSFDHRWTGYSLQRAYWLAQACDLFYKGREVIEEQARAWGLDQARHHGTRFTPPFPLQDTQACTLAGDMIITAFRGTEPARIKKLALGRHHCACPGRGGTGWVHYGFAEALNSIYPEAEDTPAELRTTAGRCFSRRLHLRPAPHPRPGVGQGVQRGLRRPHVPVRRQQRHRAPAAARAPFTHPCPGLRHIGSAGRLHDSMPLLGGLADRTMGMTADPLAPAGVRDHFMSNYIAVLEKNLS